MGKFNLKWILRAFLIAPLSFGLSACSAQKQNEFTTLAQGQNFRLAEVTEEEVGPKLTEMLFVIDDSASMGPAQSLLANSFANFASAYFKPEYNICVGVITTSYYTTTDFQPIRKLCSRNPDGSLVDLNQMTADFTQMAKVGIAGESSERPIQSLHTFLQQNERLAIGQRFFRAGSFRVVAMITDEEDQTVVDPNTNQFRRPAYVANCQRTMGSYTYLLQTCPNLAVTPYYSLSAFKGVLDSFFAEDLDANSEKKLGYMMVGVTLSTEESLKLVRKKNTYTLPSDPSWVNLPDRGRAHDRAKRVEDLVALVGNGSFVENIASASYTPILERIGQQIEQRLSQFSQFTLSYAPKVDDTLVVTITRASGQIERVNAASFRVEGRMLVIVDQELIRSFRNGDYLNVYYVPASLAVQ